MAPGAPKVRNLQTLSNMNENDLFKTSLGALCTSGAFVQSVENTPTRHSNRVSLKSGEVGPPYWEGGIQDVQKVSKTVQQDGKCLLREFCRLLATPGTAILIGDSLRVFLMPVLTDPCGMLHGGDKPSQNSEIFADSRGILQNISDCRFSP